MVDYKYILCSTLGLLILSPGMSGVSDLFWCLCLCVGFKLASHFEFIDIKPYIVPDFNVPSWMKCSDLYLKKCERIQKALDCENIDTYVFTHIYGADIQQITFKDVEKMIETNKDYFSNIDLLVGIETGGAVLMDCVNHVTGLNIETMSINCKARSGHSTLRKFIYGMIPALTSGKLIIKDEESLIKKLKEYSNKRVMIFDDSIYSGVTIKLVSDYIKQYVSDVSVYTFFNYNKTFDCLQYSRDTKIKMTWPWGYECD